jgi:hypothetical protein
MSDPNSIPPILSPVPELLDQTCQSGQTCWNGRERRQSIITLAEEVTKRLDRQDDLLLQFHDELLVHLSKTEETKELVNELLELYKGSKFMVTVFKFFVPIVAAIAAAILWIKEHLK